MICRYLPPNGGGTDAPGTLGELVADRELAEVAQLRLVQSLALAA